MKSVMQHSFSRSPTANIPRSLFDRSHGRKTTFDAGYLIPVLVDEAVPGDTFRCQATALVRLLAPLQKPIMDNLFIDIHFFSVPLWQIWDNFFKFMGERYPDPDSSIDYTVPQMVSTGYAVGSLQHQLGLRPTVVGYTHSALFTRAYNWIYETWYKDQNLIDGVVVDRDDGPDTVTDYVLRKRGKRHDYFTSALPTPQKGDAVELPLGTAAPVLGIGKQNNTWGAGAANNVYESDGTQSNYASARSIESSSADTNFLVLEGGGAQGGTAGFPYIYADLSSATAATINQIRLAIATQQFLERDMRGGTRYPELIYSHFKVTTPDARVKRPEFLGSYSQCLDATLVANTSATATQAQADLGAFLHGQTTQGGFTKSFTEHCIVMGIASIRADLTYQQGMNRMWSRSTRYDFYWPEFAHLGEQAVLNQEIFVQATGADDDVFGYQERHAEYRYKPSEVLGLFNSDAAGTLDFWHLSQDFSALPTLGQTFIEETPPVSRVVATGLSDDFIADFYFKYLCARPIPMYGVPGLTRL